MCRWTPSLCFNNNITYNEILLFSMFCTYLFCTYLCCLFFAVWVWLWRPYCLVMSCMDVTVFMGVCVQVDISFCFKCVPYILLMPLYLPILRWQRLVATLKLRYIIARIWRTTGMCCWVWSMCVPSCGRWARLRVSLSRPRLKWVMVCGGMVWSNHRAKSHEIWNFTLCVRNMHNHDAIHAEINIWD